MRFGLIHNFLYTFASTYGSNGYGEGEYGRGGPLDTLANTGWDVLIPAFLGISLIVASLILIVRKLARKRRAQKQD